MMSLRANHVRRYELHQPMPLLGLGRFCELVEKEHEECDGRTQERGPRLLLEASEDGLDGVDYRIRGE